MADDSEKPIAERLDEINTALAEWTARSTENSEALLQRLEGMGYDLDGKSEDEIVEVLKKPPTRRPSTV